MRMLAVLAAIAGVLSADVRCRQCHPNLVASYARTGMGRSITVPVREAVPEQEFRHQRSGNQLAIRSRSGKLIHELSSGGRRVSYQTAWAVGSGNQGKSYLVAVGDALFQSPISWYTERKAWDTSPGFEGDPQPDFFRPVTAECLSCHSGQALPREGTLNRYAQPPFAAAAIGCDRCHGDASVHLTGPSKNNIVNPSRLPASRRDSVCEQCHLSGEARIPNPGRRFSDFRPGMQLEEVFTVYLKNRAQEFKVVSHSEQMNRSRCFLESGGRMWCGTCHDPHQEPTDRVSWFRGKCLECHNGEKTEAHQSTRGGDCAGCHMPKLRPYDGGHTAFHDHWIRRERKQEPDENAITALRAWREPESALRARNLGLAYISAGSKNGSTEQLVTGLKLLGAAPADGAVDTARGFVLLRMNKSVEATQAFRRAADEQPQDSTRQLNLAAALLAAGDRTGAKRHAQQAIELEPLLEDAYAVLAEIEPQRAAYWRARYLKLVPQRLLP